MTTLNTALAAQGLFEEAQGDSLRGSLRPERTCFDVLTYDLRIAIDTASKSISGQNTIRFLVVQDTHRIQLDLFANMAIDSVIYQYKPLNYSRQYNAVFVDFPQKLITGDTISIQIAYSGKPIVARNPPWDGGFVWTKDSNGKPWITVSCQGIGASLWWPCKDHQSDEPNGMNISCSVPEGLQCISNGRETAANHTIPNLNTYRWEVSYPINTYNVTLNIGDYAHLHDDYIGADGDSLAIDYYVLSKNKAKAEVHFQQVKPMLACYEQFLGKYPFWRDGYALVETPYLGMEHQSAIAYGNRSKTGYLGMDRSGLKLPFDYIIIHETGHEWWGNSVTSSDIADMWIHEGFCTYSEAIYVECMYGYDTAMTYVNALKNTVSNKAPIIGTFGINREGHSDMYVKGMLFLNTLRHVVNNDDLWWRLIKNCSDTAFKMQIVDYDKVVNFFSEKSGMDLRPVFAQYVKHASLPVLEYCLKKKGEGYLMKYRWKANAQDFAMPIELLDGNTAFRIVPTTSWKKTTLNNQPEFDDLRFYYNRKKLLN